MRLSRLPAPRVLPTTEPRQMAVCGRRLVGRQTGLGVVLSVRDDASRVGATDGVMSCASLMRCSIPRTMLHSAWMSSDATSSALAQAVIHVAQVRHIAWHSR